MTGSETVFFIIAFGFVTGALVNYAGGISAEEGTGFRIRFETPAQVVSSFFICMLAGPYLTLEKSLSFWRQGQLSSGVFCAAAMVSLMWSFCSGIFIIQLLVLSGLV